MADRSGNTRLIDVTIQPGDEGHLIADVHFASQDRMNGFEFDVSVAVFDDQGRIIATGRKADSLLVKSHIVEETWQIPLPNLMNADRVVRVAIGLSRGGTYTAPVGSTWGHFFRTTSIFPIETMLAGEDEGCWRKGLEELERQIRGETLRRGLLGSRHRWQDQVAENATHAHKLQPHADRLLQILGQAEEPAVLPAAIRLPGLSGDKRGVPVIQGLLDHETAEVREAATVALGMLGHADGLAQIDELLSSDEPADAAQRRSWRTSCDDCLIALVSMRTEESSHFIRQHLMRMIDAVELTDDMPCSRAWTKLLPPSVPVRW